MGKMNITYEVEQQEIIPWVNSIIMVEKVMAIYTFAFRQKS
jgi:hypothetical protein